MKSRILALSLVIIVLVLIIASVYYFEVYIIGRPSATNYSPTNSVYDVLKSGNTLFVLGESLLEQGNLQAAQAAYEKALPTVSDQYQAGVVELKIAIVQWLADPIGSIPLFEAIATNPNYTYSTRAYALQYIAQAHDNPPILLSAGQLQQLVSTTFAASPFSAMLVNGDTAFAYRRIYDLADSLYPLPLPEAMSAQWYANQILASSTMKVSSSTAALYQTKIRNSFSAVDGAIQTEGADPSLNIFAAQALLIKADTIRKLSIIGRASKSDVTTAYQAALNEYGTVTNPPFADGFARYDYAIYLSYVYGASQASQIQSILAPIYANPAYASGPLGIFLTGLSGSSSPLHKYAILVAGFDPKFKSFLVSLGWTSADFSS